MRRFAFSAFLLAAPIASAGEALSTPERYEECLVVHGALIVSADGVDIAAGTEAAKRECSFTGKNRALVEQVATAEARKKIAAALPALDKIQDRDFVRQASCLSEEAMAIMRAQPRMTIRSATTAAIPKCPRFENSHKRDLWEVLVVAHMDVAQQFEADSDGAAYPPSKPAPPETTHYPEVPKGTESFRDPQKYGDCLVERGVSIARKLGISAERASELAGAQCKFVGDDRDFGEGDFGDGIIYTIEQRLAQGAAPPPNNLTDAQRRKIVLPAIKLSTDCIAAEAAKDPEILDIIRDGILYRRTPLYADRCRAQLDAMTEIYDRLYGSGKGKEFVEGLYGADLPRAVTERIQSGRFKPAPPKPTMAQPSTPPASSPSPVSQDTKGPPPSAGIDAFPKIDVDQMCNSRAANAPTHAANAIANTCIESNQSAYNYLKYIWPSVSKTSFDFCARILLNKNHVLGYDLWSDCITDRLDIEKALRDREIRKTFTP